MKATTIQSAMYCEKLFESLNKRLSEKNSIDQIANELCPSVARPREKVIHLIKAHRGGKFLLENADWLGYHTENIRNIEGMPKQKPDEPRLTIPTLDTRIVASEEYDKWINLLNVVYNNLEIIKKAIEHTTSDRYIRRIIRINKSIKQLKTIFESDKKRKNITDIHEQLIHEQLKSSPLVVVEEVKNRREKGTG